MEIVEIVRATIARHAMIAAGDSVLVACSGGPDSVALLHLLANLGVPISVAHFNHRLRGEESDRDEQFVSALAAARGLEFRRGEADVAGEARRKKLNIEEAARRARYAFLTATARACGAARVALGHTRDDLVETFFMKLIRGAGRTGLTSIAPVRGIFVRPLIELRKQGLIEYLRERNIAFVVDSSNADASRFRNRVRSELVPVLDRLGVHAVDRAASAVSILRAEEDYLRREAAVAYEACRREIEPDGIALSLEALRRQPMALETRALRLALSNLGCNPSARSIEELAEWLKQEESNETRRMFHRGIRACRRGERLWLIRVGPPVGEFCLDLTVPGSVRLRGQVIEARVIDAAECRGPVDDAVRCRLDLAKIDLPLTVRSRMQGESYRPFGAAGPRRVRRMLAARGIPSPIAARLPVITSGGHICWVPGLPVADELKITAETARVIEILRAVTSDSESP